MQAFVAAEDTYRAYNDALNAERSGQSSAEPREYLTGQALEDELDAQRFFDGADLRLIGNVVVASFVGQVAEIGDYSARVDAQVCLDVSGTHVEDRDGTDVTPSGRPPRVLLLVTFAGAPSDLMITSSELVEGDSC